MKKIEVSYNAESLGEIERDDYEEMLEAMIGERFGGEYEYSFSADSRLGAGIKLQGDWGYGPEEEKDPTTSKAAAKILELAAEAFNRCCRGDPLPN